jgi:hypothetical protein
VLAYIVQQAPAGKRIRSPPLPLGKTGGFKFLSPYPLDSGYFL